PSIEELQAQLEAALAEAAKNLDGWQRATAELANYKKRQDEQAARRRDDITGRIIAELFPALDDLDLAFENVPQSASEQEASWIEGFKLVQRKLIKILTAHNVQPINAEGEFDPSLHEAVTHEDHPEYDSNTIIAELRKGYKLGNRVLRPSLVRVAQ
ncbi:MAG: nucleotide exchange factor GrpE, partial [Anaerolineae bacterium]